MTDQQIAEINNRLESLTQRLSNVELLTGTIGTSQVAIVQLLNTQNEHTQILNRHTQVLDSIIQTQAEQSQQLAEILRIIRDRNGGSGL
jgi:cell division protein ZapA (FtsZ GTPase activity inhibitor)